VLLFDVTGAYFCVNMILITLSTFLAVIVINTHIRGDRKNKVPDWLRKVHLSNLLTYDSLYLHINCVNVSTHVFNCRAFI